MLFDPTRISSKTIHVIDKINFDDITKKISKMICQIGLKFPIIHVECLLLLVQDLKKQIIY